VSSNTNPVSFPACSVSVASRFSWSLMANSICLVPAGSVDCLYAVSKAVRAVSRWARWRCGDTLIAVNTDFGTITMSQSPVAVCAANRRRPSALVAPAPTSTFAAGYHCLASRATCSMMWLGTTIHGCEASPRRLSSIAPMNIDPDFPAPTT